MKNCVPIIEVNEENFFDVLFAMKSAIADSSFVAIDCELTGLGDRRKLNYPEIDLRYKYTAEIAKSFAIISVGLSCFTCTSVSDVEVGEENGEAERLRSQDYIVQTFNILTLCSDDFSVEVKAHKFLLSHGFDFNELYAKGHQYYRGCDQEGCDTPSIRELFSTILEHRKPLIIHNGLVDLMFLYQSFYSDLPKKPESFAADLEDMFPHGVYDTKYICEFHESLPATYLEYLYKKMQLKNALRRRTGDWHVRVQFPPYPQNLKNIDWQPYQDVLLYNSGTDDDGLDICENFALHGWCPNLNKCANSHDINKIVQCLQPTIYDEGDGYRTTTTFVGSLTQIISHATSKHENTPQLVRKTRNENGTEAAGPPAKKNKVLRKNTVETKTTNGVHIEPKEKQSEDIQGAGGHTAGFDAFMTGFLFATHVANHGTMTSKDDLFSAKNLGLAEHVNKIYLMGKNFPFLIRTGTYASMSHNHITKISKIRNELQPEGNSLT